MIKRKKFILFVLLFLIATSSIITWANSQNEDTPNNDPKKDVIADFDSEDKKDNQENNNPDTHNKEDEDVDKDKNENKDNSNINNEDDEKKDENTDGNEEKDNKKQDDIKNQDNQTTNPSNPIDIDNTKKENQINNTTGNILNTENISKDFHIEGNKLVKYNGTQEYVIVPDGIEVIGEMAFKDNPYVKELILPDSVKCAQSLAFSNMQNLVTIEKSAEFYTHYDDIYDGSNITYFNVRSNGK